MPKPTAQAMRAARALQRLHTDVKYDACIIDHATRLPALIEALEWYAHLTNSAPGYERWLTDGGAKARAALQDAEGSSDA